MREHAEQEVIVKKSPKNFVREQLISTNPVSDDVLLRSCEREVACLKSVGYILEYTHGVQQMLEGTVLHEFIVQSRQQSVDVLEIRLGQVLQHTQKPLYFVKKQKIVVLFLLSSDFR